MEKQQGTSRLAVVLSTLLLVVALAAFGGAFYYFDGMTLVGDLVADLTAPGGSSAPVSAPTTATASSKELVLPDGMPKEFALRLWAEQVESQRVMKRLVAGDVKTLKIVSVERKGDEAFLNSRITFRDGTVAPGVIAMRRYGDTWYVAWASSSREGEEAESIAAELPDPDTVDIALLNTIIAEQNKSSSITQEYVDGKVREITVGKVRPGPNTVTLAVEMDEDHENGYADIVVIKKQVAGEDAWFLARFNKTGTEPKPAPAK